MQNVRGCQIGRLFVRLLFKPTPTYVLRMKYSIVSRQAPNNTQSKRTLIKQLPGVLLFTFLLAQAAHTIREAASPCLH